MDVPMLGCDYNGWTDLPEEQREALDELEARKTEPPRPGRPMEPRGRTRN